MSNAESLSTQGLHYAGVEKGGMFGAVVTHSAITLKSVSRSKTSKQRNENKPETAKWKTKVSEANLSFRATGSPDALYVEFI